MFKKRRFGLLTAAAVTIAFVASACQPASVPWTSDVPSGALDSATREPVSLAFAPKTAFSPNVTLTGWAGDRNSPDPIYVAFYVNGVLQPGLTLANEPRPDVQAVTGRGANSGFTRTLEVSDRSASICVSAVNVGPGDHALLGCKTPTEAQRPTTTTTTTTPPTTTVVDRCATPAGPGVNWSGCTKTDLRLHNANLAGANLKNVVFTRVELDAANLDGADLTGARLVDSSLVHVRARNTNFASTVLDGVDFEAAQLDRSIFTSASLSEVSFYLAQLSNTAFSGAQLSDIDFVDAQVERGSFGSAALEFVDFGGALLERADFSYARIEFADFQGANLGNSQLLNTSFVSVDLTNALTAGSTVAGNTSWTDSKCPSGATSASLGGDCRAPGGGWGL